MDTQILLKTRIGLFGWGFSGQQNGVCEITSLPGLRAKRSPSLEAALVPWWGLILPAAPPEAGLSFSPSANSLGTLMSLFFLPLGNKQSCLTNNWVAKHELSCLGVKKTGDKGS